MQNKAGAYQSLLIIYFVIVGSIILLTGVMYFVTQDQTPVFDKDSQYEILMTALIIATISLGVMGVLWKKDLVRVQQTVSLPEKMRIYRSASIKAYALHDGPGIFALVCFFLTHNVRFLVIVGLVLFGLFLIYPSVSRVAKHLGISEEEVRSLEA